MFSGGYHATTYKNCFIVSNSIYLLMSATTHLLSWLSISNRSWLLILVISTVIIFCAAPVKNPHHLISARKLELNKKRCRITLLCDLLISIFLISRHIVFILSSAPYTIVVFIVPKKANNIQQLLDIIGLIFPKKNDSHILTAKSSQTLLGKAMALQYINPLALSKVVFIVFINTPF